MSAVAVLETGDHESFSGAAAPTITAQVSTTVQTAAQAAEALMTEK